MLTPPSIPPIPSSLPKEPKEGWRFPLAAMIMKPGYFVLIKLLMSAVDLEHSWTVILAIGR